MSDDELTKRALKLVQQYSAPIDIQSGVLANAILRALKEVRDQSCGCVEAHRATCKNAQY